MKVYVLYQRYYGDLVSDTGVSGDIIGVFSDIESARQERKMRIETEDAYTVDKDVKDVYYNRDEVIMFLSENGEENWNDYYESVIEEWELK